MSAIRRLRAIVARALGIVPGLRRERWVEPSSWLTRSIYESMAPPAAATEDITMGPPLSQAEPPRPQSDQTDAAA